MSVGMKEDVRRTESDGHTQATGEMIRRRRGVGVGSVPTSPPLQSPPAGIISSDLQSQNNTICQFFYINIVKNQGRPLLNRLFCVSTKLIKVIDLITKLPHVHVW